MKKFNASLSVVVASILLSAVAVQSAIAQGTTQGDEAKLTRAEVIADLQMWREAGLDKYQVSIPHLYEMDAAGHQRALNEYARLRESAKAAEGLAVASANGQSSR